MEGCQTSIPKREEMLKEYTIRKPRQNYKESGVKRPD